jgi:DNA invertase Pin-like site-specific DNA recombinase
MLIGYMRVSTDTDRQNTDLQYDALISVGVDKRHIFTDTASGAKDDRVALKEMLEFINEGDVVVVWKIDRLGRTLPHLIDILNIFKEKKVEFKSLTEGIDTTTASGELIFHIFGALAQFERNLISERVNAGLVAARKRGRIGGRPRAISEEKLDKIIESLNSGMSKAAVCRTYEVKRSTLIDTLKRVGYSK